MSCNASHDVLSALAHLLHVQDVRYGQHNGAYWATDNETGGPGIAFGIVVRGAWALNFPGLRQPVRLEAGDVAVLPHGNRYLGRERQPVRVDGSGDSETRIIGGQFVLEQPQQNFLVAALPELILVRAAEGADAARLYHLVVAIRDELQTPRPGARAIANDVASALLMMIVRIHLGREGAADGLLHIIGHRRAARAVQAMLTSPGRAWTLDELAGHASASRASLVRMFKKSIRMAPLQFLAELRLGLARRRLAATNLPLGQIAAEIGYQSESSFSRAFRRRYGMPPGKIRTQATTCFN